MSFEDIHEDIGFVYVVNASDIDHVEDFKDFIFTSFNINFFDNDYSVFDTFDSILTRKSFIYEEKN